MRYLAYALLVPLALVCTCILYLCLLAFNGKWDADNMWKEVVG